MWKEDDHPRGQPDNKGQFVEKNGGSTAESLVNKYSDNPERDKKVMRESGQIVRKKKGHLELPKKEYAELCSAVRTQYADRIPAKGQILYGDNYYQFKYNKQQERIIYTFKLRIAGNEKLIDELMEL